MPEFDWSIKAAEADLRKEVARVLSNARTTQIELVQKQLVNSMERSMSGWLTRLVEAGNSPLWPTIATNFNKEVEQARSNLRDRLKGICYY